MKRLDLSDSISNFLILAAVSVALAPILFGDELNLMLGSYMREGSLMLNDFSGYLGSLFR